MNNRDSDEQLIKAVISISMYTVYIAIIAVACMGIVITCLLNIKVPVSSNLKKAVITSITLTPAAPVTAVTNQRLIPADAWKAPLKNTISGGKAGVTINYGQELLAHTAKYFGPKGSIAHLTNGMNCQNCHLNAGRTLFANNYASFTANYPKMSDRNGKIQPASERIAECFERSLAGKVPDTAGREVKAILAYMKWLGAGVKKGQKLFGTATEKLPFMDRAASPAKGREVFMAKCQSCHGANGLGLLAPDKVSYTYPPLWGKDSYNDGAGMYRLGNFAGFVKNNMPFGATYQNPQLTNAQAWDVAAFVNSQPRPHKDTRRDYPNRSKKPIDLPFGPYADNFSQKQHKFGPFKPIKDAQILTEK